MAPRIFIVKIKITNTEASSLANFFEYLIFYYIIDTLTLCPVCWLPYFDHYDAYTSMNDGSYFDNFIWKYKKKRRKMSESQNKKTSPFLFNVKHILLYQLKYLCIFHLWSLLHYYIEHFF